MSEAIEIAHIYPFSLLKSSSEARSRRDIVWTTLKLFWSEEKLKEWHEVIFSVEDNNVNLTLPGRDNNPANLIALSRDAHNHWNNGRFALKPLDLSDDKKTLRIQFFWQKRHNASYQGAMSLLDVPDSTEGLHSYNDNFLIKGHGHTLYNPDNGESVYYSVIKSGDIFELNTEDPEKMPLPSIALLEMQWFLQRIIGIAGTVDIPEDGYWDKDWELDARAFSAGLAMMTR